MNNEPNTEPITEITEAPMETKGALIDTNDTEIQPISYSIEDQPKEQSTVELEQDLLEKPAPIKKQRTEKQIQAFRKAQEALKAKRLLRKQEKAKLPKPKRGRPIKVKKRRKRSRRRSRRRHRRRHSGGGLHYNTTAELFEALEAEAEAEAEAKNCLCV